MLISGLVNIFFVLTLSGAGVSGEPVDIHVWDMHEIILKAENSYQNYYTDVTCWVDLKGPDFSKRVYGFWDGANIFKIRIVATLPGRWEWTSGSNQPQDKGLNNHSGEMNALNWTEAELKQNPNRRGFIRPAPGGHALQLSLIHI